jgi:hypothetical protein
MHFKRESLSPYFPARDLSSADTFLRTIYLSGHVQILLRNPTSGVSAQGAGDLRVADIDVGMMVRRVRRLCYSSHEIDPRQKIPKLKSLGDDFSAAAPAWKISKLSLDRNVG